MVDINFKMKENATEDDFFPKLTPHYKIKHQCNKYFILYPKSEFVDNSVQLVY